MEQIILFALNAHHTPNLTMPFRPTSICYPEYLHGHFNKTMPDLWNPLTINPLYHHTPLHGKSNAYTAVFSQHTMPLGLPNEAILWLLVQMTLLHIFPR